MEDESLVAAGEAALRAGRWDEARSCFESVLPRQAPPRVLLGLAEAWWWLGDPRKTVEYYERGFALCRRTGDVDGAVWAALWLALTYGADFGNPAAFSGWLGRAGRVQREADAKHLEGWVRYVQTLGVSDLDRCCTELDQVLAIARRHEDFDLELSALARRGEVMVSMSRVEEGMDCIDEAMAGTFGGERSRFLTVVFTACSMIAACDTAADIERATHWCRVADRFIVEFGCPFLHARCRTGYGSVLAAAGRWDEAEAAFDAAVRIARDTFPPLLCDAMACLAALRLDQGRREDAEKLVAAIPDDAACVMPAARLYLAQGEPAVAAALLTRRLDALDERSLHRAPVLELLVEAQVSAGESGAAKAAADALDALSLAAMRDVVSARAARARASLPGDSEAVTWLEQALRLFTSAGLPIEIARTRLALGRRLVESSPDVAVVELRGALQLFDTLGAVADADATCALLRSMGVNAHSSPRDVGVLTRRERQVLELIAHGLSNPEIAERLAISRKTAAHHVSNLLSKLGLRSRAQAAAWAIRERSKDRGSQAHVSRPPG